MLSELHGPAAGSAPWNSICYQEHMALPQKQIHETVYAIKNTWPCRRIRSLGQNMLSGTHGPAAGSDPWNSIGKQEHMALPQDQIPGTVYSIRNTWPCRRIRSLGQYLLSPNFVESAPSAQHKKYITGTPYCNYSY